MEWHFGRKHWTSFKAMHMQMSLMAKIITDRLAAFYTISDDACCAELSQQVNSQSLARTLVFLAVSRKYLVKVHTSTA